MASSATEVTLARCSAITDAGAKTLHRCRLLQLSDCPGITYRTFRSLIADHDLMMVDNSGFQYGAETKRWIQVQPNALQFVK
jgi:hypothetical protein